MKIIDIKISLSVFLKPEILIKKKPKPVTANRLSEFHKMLL